MFFFFSQSFEGPLIQKQVCHQNMGWEYHAIIIIIIIAIVIIAIMIIAIININIIIIISPWPTGEGCQGKEVG